MSCVKPERSLPWGAPRELCKRHQLEVREGVQLQLQGVGDEGAGHLGRGRPARASGSSSLCTQPGGAAGPEPSPGRCCGPPRHYPHGSRRAASCALGRRLSLCASTDFQPFCPTHEDKRKCYSRSCQTHIFSIKTLAYPTADMGLLRHFHALTCAPVCPSVPVT